MSEMAFGEFAPPAVNERARAIAHRLPHNWFGRKVASLLLGPAGGRAHRAFDVTVFGTQCVRLHPYDNISEKRVFITPQFWETEERRVLADFIRKGGGEFAFIDVGANAGLYTLFARSIAYECGRPFRAVCVEPDDTMLTRLRFNLEASGAHEEAKVFPVATGAHAGEAAFEINSDNRGESRLVDAGTLKVPVRPLAQLIDEAGLSCIDTLKIDIEGSEYETLYAFLAASGARFRPGLIIAETSHEQPAHSLGGLLTDNGYKLLLQTGRNSIYRFD